MNIYASKKLNMQKLPLYIKQKNVTIDDREKNLNSPIFKPECTDNNFLGIAGNKS